ncbi:transcription repressor OFP7-like [Phragmites australis]|uniref:transcription repressor OFP7-like n=1 Tax=Phragmites australis TaxID=29695 RepID=UPI002D78BC35|nr:transcription repressor OFP7-like [Phragmites australis]
MDHDGGGRSSSRLRERLARMFSPGSLLRSTCNTNASTCSSSSSTAPGAGASCKPPPSSACSSSRALLAADAAVARDRDFYLASSSRDYAAVVGRTESFSTAIDRLHRRAVVAPAPPSRFSVDAPPLLESKKEKEKEKSPREYTTHHHHNLLSGGVKNDKTKMKLLSNPYGFSSSDDADADTDGADVFSSDADDLGGRGGAKKLGESAETFFSSSRSFSSDSSEFYTKKKNNKKKSPASSAPKPPPPPPRTKKDHQRRHRRAASSCDTCGVRDGFRPVVCAAEERVRKGFAVVKRSRDPYADFRSSMVEMILGRQLFGAPELERLLRSYLSLNAPRHHPVILQAFSDIWVVLHDG